MNLRLPSSTSSAVKDLSASSNHRILSGRLSVKSALQDFALSGRVFDSAYNQHMIAVSASVSSNIVFASRDTLMLLTAYKVSSFRSKHKQAFRQLNTMRFSFRQNQQFVLHAAIVLLQYVHHVLVEN